MLTNFLADYINIIIFCTAAIALSLVILAVFLPLPIDKDIFFLLSIHIASRLLKPIFFKAFTSYFSKIPPLFFQKHLTNPQKNAALRALNY